MPTNLYLRAGIFWARFKIRGEETRVSLRTRSERVAVKRLAALRETSEDQARFGIAGPVSWADAVVSWNEATAGGLAASTFTRYACSLRQLRGHLDGRSVGDVSAELLREIIKERRRAGCKNATIRRDLTAIGSVLNHAADEGWIEENPASTLNLRRLAPERQVRIVLPQEQSIELVFARMPARMVDLCRFTRETGLRLDEATALKHSAIDRIERTILVAIGKGNKTRVVPLTAAAEALIDRQPRYIGKPWVFWAGKGERLKDVSARIGGFTATVARQVARMKPAEQPEYHRFSHHGFRHLFAVEYLRCARGSIYDLQQLLGHTTITVTERYLAFLTPEQVKAAKSGAAQLAAQALRFEAGAA